MSDAALTAFDASSEHAGALTEQDPIRPAKPSEIPVIHARLMEAIETSPYYCDDFKAYEAARLPKSFLRNLMEIDPRHVLAAVDEGELAGFMISGPELGTLWQYWNYIFPESRDARLPMRCMRRFLETWDNDRFHKIATFSRPENRVSIALMKRYKYKHVVTLEEHMFGEDYMLFERPLTKAIPGYDRGVSVNPAVRWKNRLLDVLGL